MIGIYLTPQDYARAELNGISALNLYKRVYQYNWSIERAITTPLRFVTKPSDDWTQWKEVALAHGVNASTFRKRVYRGMEAEIAAKTPLLRKGRKKSGNAKEI